jgi:hypothetical protein
MTPFCRYHKSPPPGFSGTIRRIDSRVGFLKILTGPAAPVKKDMAVGH